MTQQQQFTPSDVRAPCGRWPERIKSLSLLIIYLVCVITARSEDHKRCHFFIHLAWHNHYYTFDIKTKWVENCIKKRFYEGENLSAGSWAPIQCPSVEPNTKASTSSRDPFALCCGFRVQNCSLWICVKIFVYMLWLGFFLWFWYLIRHFWPTVWFNSISKSRSLVAEKYLRGRSWNSRVLERLALIAKLYQFSTKSRDASLKM